MIWPLCSNTLTDRRLYGMWSKMCRVAAHKKRVLITSDNLSSTWSYINDINYAVRLSMLKCGFLKMEIIIWNELVLFRFMSLDLKVPFYSWMQNGWRTNSRKLHRNWSFRSREIRADSSHQSFQYIFSNLIIEADEQYTPEVTDYYVTWITVLVQNASWISNVFRSARLCNCHGRILQFITSSVESISRNGTNAPGTVTRTKNLILTYHSRFRFKGGGPMADALME